VGALQRLVVLDAAYSACGRPATSAAKRWRAEHPEYDEVLARIADTQQHALGSYRWGATQHLADYYRPAVALQGSEGVILLVEPLLVEGIPAAELLHPNDEPEALDTEGTAASTAEEVHLEFDEDGRGTRYRLMAGEIAGIPVVGAPDVLARAADGVLLVADQGLEDHSVRRGSLKVPSSPCTSSCCGSRGTSGRTTACGLTTCT
jgi:hypothetical protein